jgi:hypothetical protein
MRTLLFLLILGMPFAAHAQLNGPGSAEIAVTGKVIPARSTQQLSFETLSDVNFIQLNEDDTEISVDPIRDASAGDSGPGHIVAKGQPGALFRLTYSRTVVLRNTTDNTTVTVEYLMSAYPTDEQRNSTYVLETSPQFRLNEQGEYHFWLGGRLSLQGVTDGDYEGEFTMDVEYI